MFLQYVYRPIFICEVTTELDFVIFEIFVPDPGRQLQPLQHNSYFDTHLVLHNPPLSCVAMASDSHVEIQSDLNNTSNILDQLIAANTASTRSGLPAPMLYTG